MRSHFYLIDMKGFDHLPRFFSVSSGDIKKGWRPKVFK